MELLDIEKKQYESWAKFRAFCIWFPDLFLDAITPDEGRIVLDFDQRVFLRAQLRFFSVYGVMPRSWSKCITGDSIIYTDKGMIEIGSLFNYSKPEDEIITEHDINILNRYGKKEHTKLGISNGKRKTKKIVSNFGYSIEGTLNHPLLTIGEDGVIDFKKIEDFKVGDKIIINRKNDIFGTETNIDKTAEMTEWFNSLNNKTNYKIKKYNIPKVLTEDIGYFIGALIGDGCLTRDNVFILSTKDNYILEHFKNVMLNTFGYYEDGIYHNKETYDYRVFGKWIRKNLELIGLKQVDAWLKEIPEIIMKSPKNIVRSFISGLFDTDGTVCINKNTISYCSVSEKLIDQVQVVLLNFGILSKKAKRDSSNGRHHFKLDITGDNVYKFKNEIGFNLQRKQDLLDSFKEGYCNTNTDSIPFQKNNLNVFCDNSNSKLKYGKSVKNYIYHARKGNNELTYKKLDYMLKNSECYDKKIKKYYDDVYDANYFYDTVVSIEDSENYVYDIQTEETHSFISNGFVSHNTFLEALAMFLVAIFYPNVDLAMSAQTKENAASILGAKIMEIKRYWPILNNEIRKLKIDKNEINVTLYNNSTISILANAQTSKGQRRHRLNIEESALLNNELFLDVLEPIPAMPRRTTGKLGIKNPYELNGQINFFTTAGFRGSDEFIRLNSMIDDMAELNGRFVMTADWQLACWFGRGPTKEQMLKKKEENSALSFAQNYDSIWAGAGDGSLVSPNKLFNSRKIETPLFDNKDNRELYLAVDVARSEKDNNNQNALAVLEAIRDESGMLKHIDLVNMFVLSGTATFTELALYTKQLFFGFNCSAVIIDSNGLGNGLRDELLKESKDDNGKVYPCFVTFNTEAKPDTNNYVRVMFDLKPQSANTDVIVSFIDAVESGQLRLLVQKNLNEYDVATGAGYEEKVLPYLNTDLFIEEVSNLKLKQNGAGKGYSVVKNLSKIDKDRWAATAYGIWFIRTFKYSIERKTTDLTDYIIATKKQKKAKQPMMQKIQRRKSRFFDR